MKLIYSTTKHKWHLAYAAYPSMHTGYDVDYMTDEQLEAMDLVKFIDPISGMTAWRLQ